MNLIQIAGRVGRNYKYPSGEVYFLGKTVSEGMKIAVSKIKSANLFT
jgi:late competence protein required for DNA uptake (superfamily II DNA/RNA helicase)